MVTKASAILLILSAFSSTCIAFQSSLDNLTARVWTIEDGLPVNNVIHVVQDEKGYLWITTYDGLVRFDGLRFKIYNHANTPEMPHNRTTEIYIQEGEGTWISLEHGGVLLMKGDTFQHFGEEEGFTNAVTFSIKEDSNKRMFFLTHEGLFVYENQKFSKFLTREDPAQERVSFFYEDRDKTTWLATNNGLFHIAGSSIIEEFYVSSKRAENKLNIVHRTTEGKLVIGSENGVYEIIDDKLVPHKKLALLKSTSIERIYEDEYFILFSTPEGVYGLVDGVLRKMPFKKLKQGEIYHTFFRDSNGNLWVIGDLGSYNILERGELTPLRDMEILKDFWLNFIFEDREKNIWLSTSRGLMGLRESKVKTLGVEEGLSGNNILGLLSDSKGRYWVCTRGSGLNLIEGAQITHYLLSDGLASQIVHTAAEDKEGNIWVGYHQKGIDLIGKDGIKNYSLGNDVDINTVHALFVDSSGTIWAGTYAGLVRFDPENSQHRIYDLDDGLKGLGIRYITQDSDGGLWIASLDGGISYFKEGVFTNYSTEDGLSSNNIRSIYVDEYDEETIWVGSENNGLNRVKNGKIDFITIADGLPDYNIHWISQDAAQWLWMSSNKGVFRINKMDLNAYLDKKANSFRLIHFGKEDGMRNPEGNGSIQEAGLRTQKGEFWFATQEGVAIFDNKNQNSSIAYPTVLIDAVIAKGEAFSTDSVVFDPSINDFQVSFHAITFVNPEKTRFRYRFKNRENAWKELHNRRDVFFSDLSPGSYELIVQATNSNGEWSPESASLFISIQPKYYQKAWFYILLFSGLVLCFFVISRFRYQWLIAKQRKLKAVIEEQTKQLRQEKNEIQLQKQIIEDQAKNLESINDALIQTNNTKDKFFSIIAHDLRNPFQAMMGYSQLVHEEFDDFDKEKLKESIGIMKNSSKVLFELTQNLLSWANLQTGKVKPEPQEFSLAEIIEKNFMIYFQAAQQKNIELDLHCPEKLELYADPKMIDTVIRNLLSNAIKFTKSGGKVSLRTVCEQDECKIRIKDTGIGMNPELLAGVMRLDSKSTRPGTEKEAGSGLGLILCKEMIVMNGGTMEIDSTEGMGTTFTITVPMVSSPIAKPLNV